MKITIEHDFSEEEAEKAFKLFEQIRDLLQKLSELEAPDAEQASPKKA